MGVEINWGRGRRTGHRSKRYFGGNSKKADGEKQIQMREKLFLALLQEGAAVGLS